MTIERAAKAIKECKADLATDGYEPVARAALESIAEPTPEMIEAGIIAYNNNHYEDVANIWRAMIGAALKETK